MSALDKLRDKRAMDESTLPDGVNTPGKPDSGPNRTPVNPASQKRVPLHPRRIFPIRTKRKKQTRRKLKENQDAKLRKLQTASTGFSGHAHSKSIAEESSTMSSCAAGETEVGLGLKELKKLKGRNGKLISVSKNSCETKTDVPDEKHCVMIEGSLDMSAPSFRMAKGRSMVVSDKVVEQANAKFNGDSEHPMCMSPEPSNTMSGLTNSGRKEITVPENSELPDSDDEADMTSQEVTVLNKKPQYSLTFAPMINGDGTSSVIGVVVRMYPIMYCALGKDKKYYLMTEKAFAKLQMDKAAKEAELRESLISGVEAEVRKRFIKNEKINSKDLTPRALRRMSADELLHILNNCEEDAETISFIMGNLNVTAKQDLERARTELRENIQRVVAEELAEKIKNTTERAPNRVLQLRLMDRDCCNNSEGTVSFIFTLYGVEDDILVKIQEKRSYDFRFLSASPLHPCQDIGLGQIQQTRISPVDIDIDKDVFKRKLSLIPDVIAEGFNPLFGEFDTVGVVMKVEQFQEAIGQIVHLIEQNGFVLKVKFWNSLHDWDLQDVLKPGKIVACLNLKWLWTSVENTMAFAQEASEFITNPKKKYLLNGIQQLSGGMETIKQFIDGEGQSSDECSSTASTLVEEPV